MRKNYVRKDAKTEIQKIFVKLKTRNYRSHWLNGYHDDS